MTVEYLKELQKAISEGNEPNIMVYLRIVTKIMGLDSATYRRVIKRIYQGQVEYPDLDL